MSFDCVLDILGIILLDSVSYLNLLFNQASSDTVSEGKGVHSLAWEWKTRFPMRRALHHEGRGPRTTRVPFNMAFGVPKSVPNVELSPDLEAFHTAQG